MTALERGRKEFAAQAWAGARQALVAAEREAPLPAEDLERLSTAAYMLGQERESQAARERAYHSHLESGVRLAALRCAFWIGIGLAQAGERGQAGGWLGRAQRLLEGERGDLVERGYMLLPVTFERTARGEWQAAAQAAAEAAAIGERFGDQDLFSLATHERGHILVRNGRLREGVALLDEAMVAAVAGELSPIVTGIVYCGVILACQEAHEVGRAAEWTAALSEWCEAQPDLVAFTGRCRVHRAEIMQLRGSWPEAIEEAERAAERSAAGQNESAVAEAYYRRAEILRSRGELAAAEVGYGEAARRGREPQPGLALLRVAQDDPGAALAAIRRALTEAREKGKRAELLPACVVVMLAAGEVGAAREACDALAELVGDYEGGALPAAAATARGAVELAEGEVEAALLSLREAMALWRALEAPYETAKTRELWAAACEALEDRDSCRLEREAARATYAELGAALDLRRIDSLLGREETASGPGGLSPRELEVLALVAGGATNKRIAEELVISVRTVDRHVSNILAKLGVSSRAAATAWAHQHGVLE